MARKRDITADDKFFRGEDKVLKVTIDDGATPPVAKDITTWTLAFTLRRSAGAEEVLITKTSASGITITNGPGGLCQVAISDTDTASLVPGKYAYDVKRMTADAEAILVYGTLTLLPEVTR